MEQNVPSESCWWDQREKWEVADMLGYIGLQKDVNRLEKWADRNLMKLNKKCKILRLVWEGNNFWHHILLGKGLERRFAEKIFWVVDKLNRSQHCVLATKKAHDVWGCSKQISSRLREVVLPLYSGLWGHTWSTVPGQVRHEHTGESSREGHKDDKGAEETILWGNTERAGTI